MTGPSRATPAAAAELLDPLFALPATVALAALPAECRTLLVGGALRDQLLGRPPRDFDAVVAGGGPAAARALGERFGARVIELGGDRFAAYRVVTPDFHIDLWDRGETSLEDDLRRRDFTVNSLALQLADRRLLDLHGGLEDLRHRSLRATSERSFSEDPLRVLRLARFSVELAGFRAEPATLELARAAAPELGRVAAERVREELEALVSAPGSAVGIDLLFDLALYPALWRGEPAPAPPRPELVDRLERLERRAAELETERGEPAVDRAAAVQAILFGALPQSAERLRDAHRKRLLSSRRARAIEALLGRRRLPATEPERRWLLHRSGELWTTVVAYLGSAVDDGDWRAALGPLLRLTATEAEAIFTPPPLLDGHQIAELLDIGPGPRLGELAGGLRRAQIEGRVTTREEAIAWLHQAAES